MCVRCTHYIAYKNQEGDRGRKRQKNEIFVFSYKQRLYFIVDNTVHILHMPEIQTQVHIEIMLQLSYRICFNLYLV